MFTLFVGPIMRRAIPFLLLAFVSAPLVAQLPTPAQQVAAAVLPLPESLRADATVLGYDGSAALVTIRRGSNRMVCLADDPRLPAFHVACYHDGMEPFMARGRALRASGVTGDQVDSVRFREVKAGVLSVPAQPAMLYSLSGPAGSWDPATNEVSGARPLYVTYLPYATTATTGLPDIPVAGKPWLMFPGTPKAHIMYTPSM